MTDLWIRISSADTVTKNRALHALNSSGLEVDGAWLGTDDLVREIEAKLDYRRDWGGIVLGAALAIGFGAAAYYLWTVGGWWIAAAAVCAAIAGFGVVGFAPGLQKKPRKEKE
ncbi:hypothetical protein CDO52_00795 [Nocardiopsis gilva YIM 90087]|uniref:Uncharacterized protein n=1 Tax=Nocardiopsis gilva YIM 90087 TaxID=1235441 RepID=A0A223S065_9ACTN|nr:hypothetical protein [Nocardiopsis gilva]ASU81516.1 hypothetical protein CDO52_00795 [Nocardiopsis gilva YIM 90087]